jgi:hypothetical protein
MRFRFRQVCLAAAICLAHTGSAYAQAAPDSTESTAPPAAEPTPPPAAAPTHPVEWGVGLRLRNVRIPKGELELFMERSAGGTSNVGFGLEVIRRRGTNELQFGIEYEKVTPDEGVYIEGGKDVAQGDPADYILGDGSIGWLTFEVTYVMHAAINKQLAVRYGFGGGLGVVTGSLKRIDVICNGATNSSPEPGCVPPSVSPEGRAIPTPDDAGVTPGAAVAYDLLPVFPVINAIVGLQYRPAPKVTVNVEGGIRTLLFFGISGSYFF